MANCQITGIDYSKVNWEGLIVENNWIDQLIENKAKGAELLLDQYKIGKKVNMEKVFAGHPYLERFLSMNQGKQFFYLVTK